MQTKIELTKQLKTLITGIYYTEDAMKLVRLGADPDIQDENGDFFIHQQTDANNNVGGCNDQAIEELVTQFHVDIDTHNAQGLTPLQGIINNPFDTEDAMKLVRLGAYPETRDDEGVSLLDILSAAENNVDGINNEAIAELQQIIINHYQKQQTARSNFIGLLLVLVREYTNKYLRSECSHFKSLPLETIGHILSFLDFKSMGKTPADGFNLTIAAYSQCRKINQMLPLPGAFSVFQQDQTFTFFKSVHTLCKDYEKLQSDLIAKQILSYQDKLLNKKLTTTSEATLAKFAQRHAVVYWKKHSSLFKKPDNKQKLLDDIKDLEPYNDPKIQSRLK